MVATSFFHPHFASLPLPTCRESLIRATPVLNYVIDNKYLSVNWKVYFWQKGTGHQDGWPPSHHVVSRGFGKVHSQRDFQWSAVSVRYIGKVPFAVTSTAPRQGLSGFLSVVPVCIAGSSSHFTFVYSSKEDDPVIFPCSESFTKVVWSMLQQ